MLDSLPYDIFCTIVSKLGDRPHAVFKTCRAAWRVQQDSRALIMWLLETFGPSQAILQLTSVRCMREVQDQHAVIATLKFLMDAGCYIDDSTQAGCVLYWAVKRDSSDLLAFLLDHLRSRSAPFLDTWLHSLLKTTAAQGLEKCVRVLLGRGANANADGGRPLKSATEAGSVGAVKALLDAGADLHAGGETALRLCAALGSSSHLTIMELLLSRGADVHAKADEALSLAVERSNADAVALLLRYGANASARQVLESAAAAGHSRVVRLLLAHGAPPNADGGRPLKAAAEAGAVDVVRQLLDAGACCGSSHGRRRSLGQRIPSTNASHGNAAFLGSRLSASLPGSTDRPSTSWNSTWGVSELRQRLAASHIHVSSAVQATHVTTGFSVNDSSVNSVSGPGIIGSNALPIGSQTAIGTGLPPYSVSSSSRPPMPFIEGGMQPSTMATQLQDLQLFGNADVLLGSDDEDDTADDLAAVQAGSQALRAALCAGETEVVRVLLERGAQVDTDIIAHWHEWHHYPAVITVLHEAADSVHASLADSRGATCRATTVSGSAQNASTLAKRSSDGVDTQHAQHGMRRVSSGSGQFQVSDSSATAVDRLEHAVVSAAREGAESALRLFLNWGSPAHMPDVHDLSISLRTAYDHQQPSDQITQPGVHVCTSCKPHAMHASKGYQQSALGVLSSACLSSALTAAAAANRAVIVRMLLAHQPCPIWTAAMLQPSALHAAVQEGNLEILKILLQAGVAGAVLKHAAATSSSANVINKPPSSALPTAGPTTCMLSSSCGDATAPSYSLSRSPFGSSINLLGVASPPPPLQSESWGTVILCAAAACKAGVRPAHTCTVLLLQHGFSRFCKDALRLVSVGRVPPWREDATAAILQAAFTAQA